MKKKLNWIIAVIVILLCFHGCGKKPANNKQTATQPADAQAVAVEASPVASYCGTWAVSGINTKGIDFTVDQAIAMGLNDADKITLILSSDQKACLAMDGTIESGIWAKTDNGIRLGTTDLTYTDGHFKLDVGNELSIYFEKQSDNQEIPEASSTASAETGTDNTAAEEASIEPETIPVPDAPSQPEATVPSGIRPEFREAMDSYEAFYDEYCDLLAQYTKNPTDLSLLSKYSAMLGKAEEMDKKFEAWDEGEMSNEELKYYLDVNTRIQKKLVDLF